jgi:CheY-like chemotaxis protein
MFTSLPHILIVDDSPLNLEILSAALINEYEIETVQSGRQALALAQQLQPDVILLDVSMPEMDGFEVCQRLKQNPATAELPVIFLTSIESSESEAQGLALGALDYIVKPFQIEIVRARVRNLLALHHTRHTLQLALGSARLGIWQWELNGDHVWFDNSMPSPLGYAPGEMPEGPQSWDDFVHPDDLLGLELCRQKLRRNAPHFEIELRLRNKQDTWTWVLVAGEPLKRTGQKKHHHWHFPRYPAAQAGRASPGSTRSRVINTDRRTARHDSVAGHVRRYQPMPHAGRHAGLAGIQLPGRPEPDPGFTIPACRRTGATHCRFDEWRRHTAICCRYRANRQCLPSECQNHPPRRQGWLPDRLPADHPQSVANLSNRSGPCPLPHNNGSAEQIPYS